MTWGLRSIKRNSTTWGCSYLGYCQLLKLPLEMLLSLTAAAVLVAEANPEHLMPSPASNENHTLTL